MKNLQTVNERSMSFARSFAYVFCEFEGFCAFTREFCIAWLTVNVATKIRSKNANNITLNDSKLKLGKISTKRWQNFHAFFLMTKPQTHPHRDTSVVYVFQWLPFFVIIFHYFAFVVGAHEGKINLQWDRAPDLCKSMFDFGMLIQWYI